MYLPGELGAGGRTRTCDSLTLGQVLYRHRGLVCASPRIVDVPPELHPQSGQGDLNARPPRPERGALPSCAMARSGRQDLNLRLLAPQASALPS